MILRKESILFGNMQTGDQHHAASKARNSGSLLSCNMILVGPILCGVLQEYISALQGKKACMSSLGEAGTKTYLKPMVEATTSILVCKEPC